MEQEIATQAVGLGGATDFSLWKLFLRADFVVKAVILILIASSIFSWALIFDKVRLFRRIDISTKSGLREEMIKKANGKRTIPQIFFDNYHVGGYVELRELEKKGELNNLLK